MRDVCNVHWILDNSIRFQWSLSDPLQASFQLNVFATANFPQLPKRIEFLNQENTERKFEWFSLERRHWEDIIRAVKGKPAFQV